MTLSVNTFHASRCQVILILSVAIALSKLDVMTIIQCLRTLLSRLIRLFTPYHQRQWHSKPIKTDATLTSSTMKLLLVTQFISDNHSSRRLQLTSITIRTDSSSGKMSMHLPEQTSVVLKHPLPNPMTIQVCLVGQNLAFSSLYLL